MNNFKINMKKILLFFCVFLYVELKAQFTPEQIQSTSIKGGTIVADTIPTLVNGKLKYIYRHGESIKKNNIDNLTDTIYNNTIQSSGGGSVNIIKFKNGLIKDSVIIFIPSQPIPPDIPYYNLGDQYSEIPNSNFDFQGYASPIDVTALYSTNNFGTFKVSERYTKNWQIDSFYIIGNEIILKQQNNLIKGLIIPTFDTTRIFNKLDSIRSSFNNHKLNDQDTVIGNEFQNLSLASNVLSISNGNSVNLSSYVNTDNQILTGTYNSTTKTITLNLTNNSALNIDVSTLQDVALTQEQIQDYIGTMVNGNTESNIVVTYNDAANTFDFSVPILDTIGLSNRLNATINLINNHIANDKDLDSLNERQILSIVGNQLSLNKGGGTVTLPTSIGESTTVTDSPTIDHTLLGTNISSSVIDGSITPQKLDRTYLTNISQNLYELTVSPSNNKLDVLGNFGQRTPLGTYTDANVPTPFGWSTIYGNTNTPNNISEIYKQRIALGSDYQNYGLEFAYPRYNSTQSFYIRNIDNGSIGNWQDMSIGSFGQKSYYGQYNLSSNAILGASTIFDSSKEYYRQKYALSNEFQNYNLETIFSRPFVNGDSRIRYRFIENGVMGNMKEILQTSQTLSGNKMLVWRNNQVEEGGYDLLPYNVSGTTRGIILSNQNLIENDTLDILSVVQAGQVGGSNSTTISTNGYSKKAELIGNNINIPNLLRPFGIDSSFQFKVGDSLQAASTIKNSQGRLHLIGTDSLKKSMSHGAIIQIDSNGVNMSIVNQDSFIYQLGSRLNKQVYYISAVGNTINFASFASLGQSLVAPTTVNLYSRQPRLNYTSLTPSGSLSRIVNSRQELSTGITINTQKYGGFCKQIRIGINDTIRKANFFVGLRGSTVTPTNVVPSTLTDIIGIGSDSLSSNMKLYIAGTTAQPSIDLGIDFPKSTQNMYDVEFYVPPGNIIIGQYEIRVKVKNITTQVCKIFKVKPTNVNQIPNANTLLNPLYCYRSNGSSSVAASFSIFYDYTEAQQF
jgi:hypothetical protein